MAVKVIENNSVTFNVTPYLTDRGWEYSTPTVISHSGPNSGDLVINSFQVREGVSYEYSFNVTGMTDGSLVLSMGGVTEDPIVSNGYVQGTILTENTEPMTFFSDGDLTLSNINLTEQLTDFEDRDGKTDTITWSENRKGWVTFKDIIPESGFSMFTKMFTLKDGNLWEHKVDGTIPNKFYDVQYSSSIKFPVSSVGVKTYHSIAVHSNKILGTTEDGITTQLGNVADLVTFDFQSREGVHYANKLRDEILNDKLKGRYIVVELTDQETKDKKLQLFKVVVKSEISTLSE